VSGDAGGAYRPETYGERWAAVYDEFVSGERGPSPVTRIDTDSTVALLADLADGGRILELGIGTGRVAIPLAERGVEVHGIDAAEPMVARMREKPGGTSVPVTIGDFADVDVDGEFDLVFAVFNTFFALASQEDQVRCFANVAARLGHRGVFVLEVFVPDLGRFDGGQTVRATEVGLDEVVLETSRHDPVAQRVTSSQVTLRDGASPELRPVELRYAWPAELDLMARLAGLELHHRWGGWDRSPFTPASRTHVSVYGHADT
jgi:SAM-dependent methyltransferase